MVIFNSQQRMDTATIQMGTVTIPAMEAQTAKGTNQATTHLTATQLFRTTPMVEVTHHPLLMLHPTTNHHFPHRLPRRTYHRPRPTIMAVLRQTSLLTTTLATPTSPFRWATHPPKMSHSPMSTRPSQPTTAVSTPQATAAAVLGERAAILELLTPNRWTAFHAHSTTVW